MSLGTLERPMALDLVSIDLVGPRSVGAVDYYIVVMVDHCTRFMACSYIPRKTASATLDAFLHTWVQVLSCPKIVLTDNGKEFGNPFASYVTEVLGCKLIHSAIYHPAGNGINEASHRALNSTIAAAFLEGQLDFPKILTTATMIHNATPHSSTGISPYAALYGREPLLPGWQGYTSDTTNEARLMNLNSAMVQRLMQVSIQEMQPRRSPVSSLQPGDLCCYYLPTTTATHDPTIEKELDRKFRPTWSAPMVVVAVAPTQVTIRPYGAARPVRKLSVHDVRKLEFSESADLQELNTYILERHCPRVPCPCPIGSCSCPYQEQSHPSKKRPRPTPRLIYSPVLLP